MKFRPQRGGLDAAMKEVVDVEGLTGLAAHLKTLGWKFENVTVEPYGFDKRIGWDTHLVCVDGKPVGYTDGPAKD